MNIIFSVVSRGMSKIAVERKYSWQNVLVISHDSKAIKASKTESDIVKSLTLELSETAPQSKYTPTKMKSQC